MHKNKSQTSHKAKLIRRKSVCTDASSNERASIFTANINASLDMGKYESNKIDNINFNDNISQNLNKKISMVSFEALLPFSIIISLETINEPQTQ